jgi:hypothetical protein
MVVSHYSKQLSLNRPAAVRRAKKVPLRPFNSSRLPDPRLEADVRRRLEVLRFVAM